MKKLIQGMGFLLLCFFCWGIPSSALEQDVILTAEENKVEVSTKASVDQVVSMRVSLDVEITEGDGGISFEFSPGISSTVKQYRYEKETGTLNIYVSGKKEEGFALSEELSLGKVVLDAGEGSAAATIRVKEDGVDFVNDAFDMQRPVSVNASPEQKISVGNTEKPDPGNDGEEQPGGDGPEPGEDEQEEPDVEEPGYVQDEEDDHTGDTSGGSSGGNSASDNASVPAGSGNIKPPPNSRMQNRRNVGIRTGSSHVAVSGEDPDSEPDSSDRKLEEEVSEEEEQEPQETPSVEEVIAEENEKQPDFLLIAVILAAVLASGAVIFLMVLEYRRQQKKKEEKARSTEKAKKKKKPKTRKKIRK